MIGALQKISTALKSTQTPTTYNASLPILIKVLAKLKGDMYLLQIGTQKIETKSYKPLHIGERYWGEMGRSSLGHIALKNLIAQPKIMEMFFDAPLKFSLQNLQEMGEKSDIFEGFRDFLSYKLAEAKSREEFIFLSHLLLGLKHGVLSLVIDEKNEVLQMKRYGTNKVRFSAIMPLLGIVEGDIGVHKEGNTLDMKVLYQSTKTLLEQNLNKLKGFKIGKISINTHLSPFYEYKEALLDVRG